MYFFLTFHNLHHDLEQKISLVYILSPLHIEFRRQLFDGTNLAERFSDWRSFLLSLENNFVKICDWGLDSTISQNINSGVWRDGIHYNRDSAYRIAQECLHINQEAETNNSPL